MAKKLALSYADCLKILEASTSLSPKDMSRPVYDEHYLVKSGKTTGLVTVLL
jgi:hypothetical protein